MDSDSREKIKEIFESIRNTMGSSMSCLTIKIKRDAEGTIVIDYSTSNSSKKPKVPKKDKNDTAHDYLSKTQKKSGIIKKGKKVKYDSDEKSKSKKGTKWDEN